MRDNVDGAADEADLNDPYDPELFVTTTPPTLTGFRECPVCVTVLYQFAYCLYTAMTVLQLEQLSAYPWAITTRR